VNAREEIGTLADERRDDHHELPVHEVLLLVGSDAEHGLSDAEATRRLERFGHNELPRFRRHGPLVRLLFQLHHPLIYILIAAGSITAALGERVDASVIFVVVVVNAVVGFMQESRAEHALDALVSIVRTRATVVRGGHAVHVSSTELVPGDVVLITAGDKVPADVRLMRVDELELDESALTGESLPVAKTSLELPAGAALGDRSNMAYSGSLATRGHARGVVVATGVATEIGEIHRLVGEATGVDTPLTRKIARFSRILTVVIVSLAAVTFAIGVARGEPASDMLTAAVALAVGAIPEGLPAVVTITLAIGVSRMVRRNTIVRKLPAVETLGSTTVICTDKTGTLTENQMTVTAIVAGDQTYTVTGVGYTPTGAIALDEQPVTVEAHPALAATLLGGMLCNDAHLAHDDGRWTVVGDPTEAALVVAAAKGGIDPATAAADHARSETLPFLSERQWMATRHPGASADDVVYVKGAAERLVERCEHFLDADGTPVPIDTEHALAVADGLAAHGLRVLAIARTTLARDALFADDTLDRAPMVLLGFEAMHDPPRAEVIAAVRACAAAGIAVKMITGDHAATARAIAEEIGLRGPSGSEPEVMSGVELAQCPRDALPDAADRTTVFARVSPEQKLRLVEALQAKGHVVAMTGDGVNDAPALKQADIGVAMGRGGTEVAKESAAAVLTDDNFASIEAAVEEGRGVFDNLTKFIVWALPTSMGEGLVILAAIVGGTVLPILPVQVLWVNMTTAVALGLALAFEPNEPDIMRRPPRDPARPLLTRELVMRILLVSGIMLAGAFGLFQWERAHDVPIAEARTVAVNVFVLVEIAYLFNCRSLEHSAFRVGPLTNRWVWIGITTMLGLQLLFTYAPFMQALFHTASIGPAAWLRIAGVALAGFVVVEIEKALRRPR